MASKKTGAKSAAKKTATKKGAKTAEPRETITPAHGPNTDGLSHQARAAHRATPAPETAAAPAPSAAANVATATAHEAAKPDAPAPSSVPRASHRGPSTGDAGKER